jgi:chaperonin GroES
MRPIIPLNDYVAVRRINRASSGVNGVQLVMPETASKDPQKAVVLAAGPGRVLNDGTRTDTEVKRGDTVVLPDYCGTEVDYGDGPVLIVRSVEILAVVTEPA